MFYTTCKSTWNFHRNFYSLTKRLHQFRCNLKRNRIWNRDIKWITVEKASGIIILGLKAPFRLFFTKLPAPFAKRDELPPVSGTFLLRRFSELSNFLLLDVGLASALCVDMSDFLALNETRDTCFLSCWPFLTSFRATGTLGGKFCLPFTSFHVLSFAVFLLLLFKSFVWLDSSGWPSFVCPNFLFFFASLFLCPVSLRFCFFSILLLCLF